MLTRSFAVVLASVGFLAFATSPGASSTAAPSIRSTLDGKAVLPHRIHWLGMPSGGTVKEVEFLIDGKVRWVEKAAPYSYSEDGGYLVTSWLTRGSHHFTARARFTSGEIADDTVAARVVPAPAPPAALGGKMAENSA